MSDDLTRLVGELPAILDALQGSDVREITWTRGGTRLRLHRADAVGREYVEERPDDIEPAPPELAVTHITSDMVGTFYRASAPGMPPLVEEGSEVQDDTIVGIIEALSELIEVEANCRGTVSRVLATDGHAVEYGQPLFEVTLGG